MRTNKEQISRRSFLKMLGSAGASTAIFGAMGKGVLALSNLKPKEDVFREYSYPLVVWV